MDTRNVSHGGLNTAVAAVIQAERALAHLTIDQLADLSGIGRQTLLRRLGGKGRSDINVNEVAQLAHVFRLTPAEMIEKAQDWQRRTAGTLLPDSEVEAGMVAYRRGFDSVPSPGPPPGKKSNESA